MRSAGDSRAGEAEAVAAEIRAMGRKSQAFQADLLDEAQVVPLVARAAEALGGPLTVLVNNASTFYVMQWQDGKLVTIAPSNLALGKPIFNK